MGMLLPSWKPKKNRFHTVQEDTMKKTALKIVAAISSLIALAFAAGAGASWS